MGEIEGFTDSPCSIKQLPEPIKWDLVEDSISHTLWDREYRWVDAQGVHLDPVCNELVASLINRESDFVMQTIQSETQTNKYVRDALEELKDKYNREVTQKRREGISSQGDESERLNNLGLLCEQTRILLTEAMDVSCAPTQPVIIPQGLQAAPTGVDKAETVSANGTLHTAMATGTSNGSSTPWAGNGGAQGAEAVPESKTAYMDAQNARDGQTKGTDKGNSVNSEEQKAKKRCPISHEHENKVEEATQQGQGEGAWP